MKPPRGGYSPPWSSSRLTEEDKNSLAQCDWLVGFLSPADLADARRRSEKPIRFAWPLEPQHARLWDPEGPDKNPWWMTEALTWSFDWALVRACGFNPQWFMRDVDGAMIPYAPGFLLNWTKHCPPGNDKLTDCHNLRVSEWCAYRLARLAASYRWDDANAVQNAVMFEILADHLGSLWTDHRLQYADPNGDGHAEGDRGVGGENDPLSLLMQEENVHFWDILQTELARRRRSDVVFWMNDNSRISGPIWYRECAGVKLENWMRQPARADETTRWLRWYCDGDPSLIGPPDEPRADPSMAFVYIRYEPSRGIQWNERRLRLGVGTSLLPVRPALSGWIGADRTGQMELGLDHPLYHRELGEPLNPIGEKDGYIYVREFERCIVRVNPSVYQVGDVAPHDAGFEWR